MSINVLYVPDVSIVKEILIKFLADVVSIRFLDSANWTEKEKKTLPVIIDEEKTLFIESDEVVSRDTYNPVFVPLKVPFSALIIQFTEQQATNWKIYFEYKDPSTLNEIIILESTNRVFLSFSYLSTRNESISGENNGESSSEFAFLLNAISALGRFRADPTTYLSQLEGKSEKRVSTPKETQRSTSPVPKRGSLPSAPSINFSTWNPTYGKIIPTLHPYLLHNGNYYLITPNAPKPIPFSNDYFEGYALLLVNSSLPMDPIYTKRFEGDKNRFEVQMQGKFKKLPTGKLFVGAEITKKMELGLFTKGICNSILQFCQSFSSSLHHSFGDKQNHELPHITSPFWSTIDRLVVTKKGEKPPNMLIPFYEDPALRKKRRGDVNFNPKIDLENIYSFSLKTSFIDLEKWNVVNIPLMRSMDLHTFWSDADIRFTAYFIDPTKTPLNADGYPILHKQVDLDRIFALEMKHSSNHPEWSNDPQEEYRKINAITTAVVPATEGGNDEWTWSRKPSEERAMSYSSEAEAGWKKFDGDDLSEDADNNNDNNSDNDNADGGRSASVSKEDIDGDDNEEDDESVFFDTTDGRESDAALKAAIKDIEMMKKRIGSSSSASATPEKLNDESMERLTTVDFTGYVSNSSRMNALEPVSLTSKENNASGTVLIKQKSLIEKTTLVVAALEIDETRSSRQGGRRTLYAFRQLQLQTNASKQLTVSDDCSLRSFNEWKSMFPLIKLQNNPEKRPLNYSKLIEEEQRRIQLDLSFKYLIHHYYHDHYSSSPSYSAEVGHIDGSNGEGGGGRKKKGLNQNNNIIDLLSLFTNENLYNSMFLANVFDNQTKNLSKLQKHQIKYGSLQSEVALRISNYYYSQEFMYYDSSKQEVIFKNSSKRLGNKLIISLKNIISIKCYSYNNNNNNTSGATTPTAATTASSGQKTGGGGLVNTFKKHLPISIPNTVVMIISTFARQYLFLIHEQDPNLMNWLTLIPPIINNTLNQTSLAETFSLNSTELINDSNTIFTEKNEKMILNHRVFSQFLSSKLIFSPTNPLMEHINNPVKYVGKLLEMILNISKLSLENEGSPSASSSFSEKEASLLAAYEKNRVSGIPRPLSLTPTTSTNIAQLWIDFMDGIAYLQQMDLSYLLLSTNTASTGGSGSGNRKAGSSSGTSSSGNTNTINPAALKTSEEQTLTTQTASSNQRDLLCIFLNLYHCLLIHCYLIMGIPNNIFKWQSFFRTCSYEAFGDIFSLSELEHNILRAGMNRPNINILVKSFLPTTKFPFALTIQDYRLLWAINCGSLSNLPMIPIYEPSTLNEQLDIVIRLSLEKQLIIVNENTVMLPQLCQWYCKDFEIDLSGKSILPGGSGGLNNKQLLGVLLKHLSGDLETQLFVMLEKKTVHIKYSQFDFNCRILTKF